MATPRQSITARLLYWLSDAIYEHRLWFLFPQLVLAALCIWYTAAKLEIWTDRSALVGAEKEYHRNYLAFREELPVQDELVVVVESDGLERNRQFVERFGPKLQAETHLFTGVF